MKILQTIDESQPVRHPAYRKMPAALTETCRYGTDRTDRVVVPETTCEDQQSTPLHYRLELDFPYFRGSNQRAVVQDRDNVHMSHPRRPNPDEIASCRQPFRCKSRDTPNMLAEFDD